MALTHHEDISEAVDEPPKRTSSADTLGKQGRPQMTQGVFIHAAEPTTDRAHNMLGLNLSLRTVSNADLQPSAGPSSAPRRATPPSPSSPSLPSPPGTRASPSPSTITSESPADEEIDYVADVLEHALGEVR